MPADQLVPTPADPHARTPGPTRWDRASAAGGGQFFEPPFAASFELLEPESVFVESEPFVEPVEVEVDVESVPEAVLVEAFFGSSFGSLESAEPVGSWQVAAGR